MNASSLYRKPGVAALGVAAAVLGSVTLLQPHHRSALQAIITPDVGPAAVADMPAVKAAYEAGSVALQSDEAPQPGSSTRAASAPEIDAMVSRAKAHFHQFLTPKGFAKESMRIDGAAAILRSGMRIVSGGAGQFTYKTVTVGATSATIQGTVRVWLKLAQVRPDGSLDVATPANTLEVRARLVRGSATSQDWRVDDYSSRFAAGGGPEPVKMTRWQRLARCAGGSTNRAGVSLTRHRLLEGAGRTSAVSRWPATRPLSPASR